MGFENGVRSPMFEIMEYSSNSLSSRFPTRSISVNNSKAIRHVSMLMNLGLVYEGLRFFDESYSMITDIQWADDSTTSRWTPVQGIPIRSPHQPRAPSSEGSQCVMGAISSSLPVVP